MNSAVVKTLSLLLLIAIGYLMRNKIRSKDQKEGIKTIILSLALPATIFIALLKIEFELTMIFVPILVWVFNIVLYVLVDKLPIQSLFNVPASQHRVATLLLPSLAPGLSCFPFILEFGGDLPFAMAALGDIGNKVFVLIIAYLIAMKWYITAHAAGQQKSDSKLKDLFRALVEEPVNFVILSAIVMLALGLNFGSLPTFITTNIDRLSVMMTPLVLLFIGISMKLTRQQAKVILSFLFFRSGVAFLFSSLVLWVLPVQDPAIALLIIVFPQSACSFWPFAHMASITELERKMETTSGRKGMFDLDFAMNILACSLPFSVILILTVYSTDGFLTKIPNTLICAAIFLTLSAIPVFAKARFIQFYKSKVIQVLRSI